MCNRVLLLFGKFRQWNFHVNCHVNGTTFQSSLRFQTGLSSLRVSCKDLGSKDLNIRIFYKFLLYIKPRYICCHLHEQIDKKNPVSISYAWSLHKPVIWLNSSVKILDIHHLIFLRRGKSGKWHFIYGGIWSNFTL